MTMFPFFFLLELLMPQRGESSSVWKTYNFTRRLAAGFQFIRRVKQWKYHAGDALFIGISSLGFDSAHVCEERFKLILAEVGICIKFKQKKKKNSFVLCSPFRAAQFWRCVSPDTRGNGRGLFCSVYLFEIELRHSDRRPLAASLPWKAADKAPACGRIPIRNASVSKDAAYRLCCLQHSGCISPVCHWI